MPVVGPGDRGCRAGWAPHQGRGLRPRERHVPWERHQARLRGIGPWGARL